MRKVMATGAVAIVALLTVSACSSKSAEPTVSQVASQLGATGVHVITPTLYADNEANATLNGATVDIVTFTTKDKRDNWVKTATQFGTLVKEGQLYAVIR